MGKVRWRGVREKAVIHPFKQIPTESVSIPQVATEMGRVPLSAYARILWVDSEFLRFVLSFVGTATSLLSLVLIATRLPVPSIMIWAGILSLPWLFQGAYFVGHNTAEYLYNLRHRAHALHRALEEKGREVD